MYVYGLHNQLGHRLVFLSPLVVFVSCCCKESQGSRYERSDHDNGPHGRIILFLWKHRVGLIFFPDDGIIVHELQNVIDDRIQRFVHVVAMSVHIVIVNIFKHCWPRSIECSRGIGVVLAVLIVILRVNCVSNVGTGCRRRRRRR